VAEALRVYGRLVGARIRGDWQYRASFVVFAIAQLLASFVDFLAIAVIFGQIDRLAGWSLAEVALLYGIAGVAFNLSDVFVSPIEVLSTRIRTGTFDRVLVRPVGALVQVVAEEFALRRIGKLVQAAAVLVVALVAVDVDWTIAKWAVLLAAVGSGAVIFSAIWVIGATLAFWTTEANEVVNSVTYGGNYLTQYPISIYGRWLRRLFAFVVPLAFVAYYPALFVLERDDPLGAPEWVQLVSPLIAVAVALVARAVWTFGIRHYRSTGS
jgi:ABC-2 type transport system permease protein